MGDQTLKIKTMQKEGDDALDILASEVDKLKQASDTLKSETPSLTRLARRVRKSGQTFQIVKEEKKA